MYLKVLTVGAFVVLLMRAVTALRRRRDAKATTAERDSPVVETSAAVVFADVAVTNPLERLATMDFELQSSFEGLRKSDAAYDARGARLEKAAVESIAPYFDPANQRAAEIQDAARQLEAGIRKFIGFRASLFSGVAMLRIQMNLAVLQKNLRALTIPFPSTANPDDDPIAVIRGVLRDLKKVEARNVLLAAQAVAIGDKVVKAQQVATAILIVRQATLESYLRETVAADVDSILDSTDDLLAAEARDALVEELVGAAAEALSVAAETIVPFAKLTTIFLELRKNIQALKGKYERGDVDRMFDFSRRIQLENDATKTLLTAFDCLLDAISVEVPA